MYLSEKRRIGIDLKSTLKLLRTNPAYKIIDLNTEILLTASTLDFYKLHDRMILATAKWLDIPILSSDKKFMNIEGVKLIWD